MNEYILRYETEIPTVLQKLVRCKDCKFYWNGLCGNVDSDSPCRNLIDVRPDFFCADGERKEVMRDA